MATYTADAAQLGVQPRLEADAPTLMIATFTAATALAVGDVITMVKVPANVTVHMVELAGFLGATGSITFNCGHTATGGAANTFGATTALTSTVQTKNGTQSLGLPALLAVADTATQQYSTITLTVTAATTASTGTVIQLLVAYTARGAGIAV
jgi:hypothetical protein